MAQPSPWEALVRQLVSVRYEPRVVSELLRQAEQQIQGVDWNRAKARLTNRGERPWWKGYKLREQPQAREKPDDEGWDLPGHEAWVLMSAVPDEGRRWRLGQRARMFRLYGKAQESAWAMVVEAVESGDPASLAPALQLAQDHLEGFKDTEPPELKAMVRMCQEAIARHANEPERHTIG